ncbi:MAG TPA: sigma-70 family RNA polymerase sigma factor [Bryobacteraceae bacterium]|nr:sigma-70 family RNA polymerase sigma factor [Bryobacteraceae bacterium]
MVATIGRRARSTTQLQRKRVEQRCSVPAHNAEKERPGERQPVESGEVASSVDWAELVDRIHGGDESGMEELYRLFAKGVRFYLCRQLGGQEIEDKIHDTFLIVVKAIRRGDLREPERLMGFIRTVLRRQVAAHIDHLVHRRRDHLNLDLNSRVADARRNPEQSAAFREKIALMLEVLREMSERDRNILTRFYLKEQGQEQICEEMGLTDTQFRLLKSRAKARFGEMGQRKLQKNGLRSVFLRSSSSVAHSGE